MRVPHLRAATPSALRSDAFQDAPPPSEVRALVPRTAPSARRAPLPCPPRHPSSLLRALVFPRDAEAPRREPTVEALLRLGREGATGLLALGAPGACTRLYFSGGRIVFADDDTLGRSFAEALVARGKIASEAYGCAFAHMPRKVFACEQMRLAEVLVELGMLRGDEAHEALGEHVADQVTEALAAEEHAWSFDPVAGGFRGVARLPRSAEAALLAAARAMPLGRAARVLAIDEDRRPRLARPIEEVAPAFVLTAAEAGFAARLDGTRSVVTVLESAPAHVDPRGVLVALVLARAVALDAPGVDLG